MLNNKAFPKDLINIIKTIKHAGFKCYIVGGGVRDLLLGLKPKVWDLTTDATPKQITKLFKKVVPTGIKFGTVTVLINKVPYEITTFRSDERYVDGRHPSKVTFSNDLKKDLSRRDFTINAIAYDPTTRELVDIFGGQKDLKAKLIRAVGNPVERFREDGLRPVRACRFAAKLNFKIEDRTLKAIPKCLNVAKKVSMERVHDELMRMLEADKPSIGIDLMRKSGLLKIYIPELLKGIGVKQPKPFHKDDVYWHSLYTCDAVSKDKPILRLAALLHDIAKPRCKAGMTFYDHEAKGTKMAYGIMKRLKFSNAHIDYVMNLIKNHMFNYSSEWSDAAIRRFIRRVGSRYLDDLFELRVADIKAMGRKVESGHPRQLRNRINKILREQNALHIKDMKVDGNDVMKVLGIKPGPKVGEVLGKLLEKVLDDPELNTKPKLLELIREYK
jgi:poly(A) polymerase/tRNA nucleotidyltransferase (CCA-adding enzyme)